MGVKVVPLLTFSILTLVYIQMLFEKGLYNGHLNFLLLENLHIFAYTVMSWLWYNKRLMGILKLGSFFLCLVDHSLGNPKYYSYITICKFNGCTRMWNLVTNMLLFVKCELRFISYIDVGIFGSLYTWCIKMSTLVKVFVTFFTLQKCINNRPWLWKIVFKGFSFDSYTWIVGNKCYLLDVIKTLIFYYSGFDGLHYKIILWWESLLLSKT